MKRHLFVVLLMAAVCPVRAAQPEAETLYRGNFAIGRLGAVFSPCFSATRIVVEDATAGEMLTAAYREISEQAGRAIFVEFSGRKSNGGLRAQRLHRASRGGPGCRERLLELKFAALGSEPVWGLEARAANVRLRLWGESAPREFPPGNFVAAQAEARYEGATPTSLLRVIVRPGICRDALSGSIFDHRVEIQLDARILRGCGYWGDLGRASP
ncbi:MAG: hypothetical protein OEW21_11305 [Betaproteobacteria bacterium]|nr:hypothetical protein [Betaproteobacteria bacterium]